MSDTKVVTNEVRLSFVRLLEPVASGENGDGPKKYSVKILVPKSDKKTIKKLRAAQQQALEDGKDSKFGGKIPKGWKDTIHDGDEDSDLDDYPEDEGNIYFSASANEAYPPGVVDRKLNPILDASEIYSGMYARVSLNCYAYNTQGNKGVTFGLRHVQKLRDGEPLGGSAGSASDDFDELDDDDDDDDVI